MLELLKSEREVDEKEVQKTIHRVETALNQLKDCAATFVSESTDNKPAPSNEEELLTRARMGMLLEHNVFLYDRLVTDCSITGTFGVLKLKNDIKGHRRTGSLGSPRNAGTKGDRSLATDFISSLSTASSPTVSEEVKTFISYSFSMIVTSFLHRNSNTICAHRLLMKNWIVYELKRNKELSAFAKLLLPKSKRRRLLRLGISSFCFTLIALLFTPVVYSRALPVINAPSNIPVDQGDVAIKRKVTKVLPGKRPEAPLPKALEVK